MRYLKLFEYYSNKLYTQITVDDYVRLSLDLGHEKLSEIEISYIESVLPTYLFGRSKIWSTSMSFRSDDSINIYINKHKDEWFLIEFWPHGLRSFNSNHIYYKCDQFDGLKECLKNLLSPK